MRPELRLAASTLLITLALAACDSKQAPETKGVAGGEVLPGSASDAMLPVDSVRSQPPLAPRPEASGKKESASGGKSATPADAAPEAPADSAPAEAPPEVRSSGE